MKYFRFISFFIILQVFVFSQDEWKINWSKTISQLDSMFQRERFHFKRMQSYQNEANEQQILNDIDTLHVLLNDINIHITLCNDFVFSENTDSYNASETFKLKIDALKEYFEQCRMQILINNQILQKRLKNESLDFKVKTIEDLKIIDYIPNFK